VDELIATLEANSYTSHAPASGHATDGASVKLEQHTQPVPIESIVGTSTSEYLPYPLHASNKPPANAPRGPAATRVPAAQHRLPDRPTRVSPSPYLHQDNGHTSRKRKLKERDTSQPREGHDTHSNRASGGERPAKQTARRGGKTGRDGGMMIQNGAPGFGAPSNAPFAFPPFPEGPPFPDVPPFDPTNPMAFLAMAAAFGVNVPGMPGSNTQGVDISNVSCPDYETKGYCATGSICPFQHGGAITVSADSLPKYSSLAEHSEAGNERSHGGSRVRAPFSNPGPTHDRTNTTLVVEQIPHDNFSEQDVRDFFSSFGTLVDVQMQAYKRLAIIKYDTHDAAKRAYNSPKAVFDNRFVKVYWHKSRSDVGPPRTGQSEYGMNEASYQDEEILDPEEVRKRQVEAQRSFDNRRKKDEEVAAKAGEIDRKLRETNAEVQRLKRELAAKSRHGSNGNLDEEFSQDLANLQAEAEDLFAQQDTHASQSGERGRGSYRGGYHGRGNTSFPSRGGYAPSLRGGYQGRGGYYNGSRTGVKRLDNRPRRIAVANIQPGSKRDEALRQHLIVRCALYCVQRLSTNYAHRTFLIVRALSSIHGSPTV
jgi:RNA recognition motif-containing protein